MMNRWLMIGSLAGMLTMTTGCLHHHTRKSCNSCPSGHCNGGTCHSGGGLLGKMAGNGGCKGCNNCQGCRTGCVPGHIGWQQGGLDYSSHLNPGLLGHNTGAAISGQPFQPGPPSAQVAYPYYTHRGPRDFLLDNPPSIGR